MIFKYILNKYFFSLIEVVVSMAILVTLIAVAFSFFSSAQNTWSITNSKQETFENARIALDLMSRDMESAIYKTEDVSAPFWHWKPIKAGLDPASYSSIPLQPSDWGEYRNELIAFVCYSPIPPNEDCNSNKYEVKYQLYYATNHNDTNEGWLRRSITGNIKNTNEVDPAWNWQRNSKVGFTCANYTYENRYNSSAFTANSQSSSSYQKLIPNVLEVSFSCDTDTDSGRVLAPDQSTSTASDACIATEFPKFITISLTLLDKPSWDKWISLCGSNVCHAPEYAGEPDTARRFRESYQNTFTKIAYLGDRGQ